MSAIVVLMIVGGAAGLFAARVATQAVGLLVLEPALVVPVAIAGVATGGMAGLTVALGGIAVWDRVWGHTPIAGMRVILTCVGATALGASFYLGVVGGLVWFVGRSIDLMLTGVDSGHTPRRSAAARCPVLHG